MSKQKTVVRSKEFLSLYAIIGLLLILCSALGFAIVHMSRQVKSTTASSSISLGAMQYTFANGKAIKRNDASIKSLRAFLANDALHEGCSAESPAYEHVAAYNKEETQVLIKYGCGAADSPIFAVKNNSSWHLLSPTNHFDLFAIPDCGYLTANNISTEIAPVCTNNVSAELPIASSNYLVR